MAKVAGVYRIYNKINKKVYIGQALDISRRWRYHLSIYKTGDSHLYASIRKYGINNFEFSIEQEFSSEDFWKLSKQEKKKILDEAEKGYIVMYNSTSPVRGYNMTKGGEGGTPNSDALRKRNEEIKKAWQDPVRREQQRLKGLTNGIPEGCTFKGRRHKEESLQLMRRPKEKYERHLSEADLQKVRATSSARASQSQWYNDGNVEKFIDLSNQRPPEGWVQGRLPFSSEQKKALSLSATGGKNPRAISVYCVETEETFLTLKDAATKYKINYVSTVTSFNKGASYKGYTFIKDNREDGWEREV